MAKRQRSISLSFVLVLFAVCMIGSMLLCGVAWFAANSWLRSTGVIYEGYISNQQVEQMLGQNPDVFVSPGEDFLAEYALFGTEGEVLETNVEGKELENLAVFLQGDVYNTHICRHTYPDKSTIIIQWHFRKEFANPVLRNALPPYEHLWMATLGAACVLCLLLNILWLYRLLTVKLEIFGEVSGKIGTQELDFIVPEAGIREYDRALNAMEHMRKALYDSLSSQWTAQQEREAEIAALAHDLKTPLTLAGGNAELLLDEDLSEYSRKRAETIVAASNRARQYVASLLETSAGIEERFDGASLPAIFDVLCQSTRSFAREQEVCLQVINRLEGAAKIQKEHLLRALSNIVQNAIEYTPSGRNVYLEGSMTEDGWQVTVRDEGPGFSAAALRHGTKRLWRGDSARGSSGHNGLGLWFAARVIRAHAGQLELDNCNSGGLVTIKFGSVFPKGQRDIIL